MALTVVQAMIKKRKKMWLNGDLYLFSYFPLYFFKRKRFPANRSDVEIKYCSHTPNTPPVMLSKKSTLAVENATARGTMTTTDGRRMWSSENINGLISIHFSLNSSLVSAFKFSRITIATTTIVGLKANTG